jgi:antirestriction protein
MENVQTTEIKKEIPKDTSNEYSIYIACLASYNNGILFGKWIKPSNDVEELQGQINEILKSSSIPNAEEWAIHDYDDFHNLGENPNLEDITKIVEAYEEHGIEEINAFLTLYSVEDLEHFEESYQGEHDSFLDYATNMFDECYLHDVPESVVSYIDYEKFARDLNHDYNSVDSTNGVFVFSSNW